MSDKQIPLELKHTPSYAMVDFIVSSSNSEAYGLLDGHGDWPGHVAAVVGPEACGKSHLVRAWGAEHCAQFIQPGDDVATIPARSMIVLDNADDNAVPEEWLFHLYNWVKEVGGKLVLTSRENPTRWQVSLPDLRSPLATVTIGKIAKPDDMLITALLVKLFSDRQLQVDMAVIDYILPRLERSFAAVHSFVEQVDASALASQRKITKALVKNCF